MTDLVAPADPRALIDIAVRPEADAFPMFEGDAFLDLAIGIRDNGQLDPIELDVDGAIGEGRNRYAACRWLGIEPWCVTLPAETDWFVRVIERNLNRRHATAGARAVALVRAAGSRGTSLRNLGRVAGLSHPTLSRARFLVEHAPELAEQVVAGASLRAAYDRAVEDERARTDSERSAVDDEARRIARLEEIERERATLVERLRAVRDADGETVAIPPEPELAIRIETADDAERATVPSLGADVASLRAQERLHAHLRKIKTDLTLIRDAEVDPNAAMFEGLVMAIRSWATHVVALTYEIVEQHNAALASDVQLRRVK
ncbi:MAG: hypothetical protein ACJ780_17545 [Solirubrobacteraceae bacterium]|jgi:hypothetical protein